MSSLIVEIDQILSVVPHPNADRLDIVKVRDWQCVVQKGSFKLADKCLYIPIDSVLPPEVEGKLFGPDSKVKLHHSRVKTIKLRGAVSQGMAVHADLFGFEKLPVGTPVGEKLGIKKYEPPQNFGPSSGCKATSRKQVNPHFHKYTAIENFKNYPKLFSTSDTVVATEKIHGTNFRAGWVPFHADTVWKKIKSFFGFAPKWEFVYGSHNVQLQSRWNPKTWHDKTAATNVYMEAVQKYQLRERLEKGQVVYGEIYGDGIQKGYAYGCKTGERKVAFFDIMVNDHYLPFNNFMAECNRLQLPSVPFMYSGPYNEELLKSITSGASLLCREQLIREGIVVRPAATEETTYAGRKILKLISEAYLLGDQSEFH